ncbi:hypothetical protein BJ878DRAFT_532941 [Calycina marina]|uniref:Uncharacterized protein n=1 Tax=Calycina marina TaxID=1763456 RepID=A0A9P8CHG7_9HELO|nr:hypothetical protein BJ878DRAFT_532941 [Calycina marina]
MMSAHLLQITPPESFTSSPPTPPATEEKSVPSISRIITEVRRHKDGHYLNTGEHWLRYDYFPLAELYVLRMPSSLHESLGSYITQELLRELCIIAQGRSPSAVFAGNIENSASAEISFEDTEYGSHQPDASFQHFKAQYPGVILELSSHEYILGSDADIRVVIGIDVEYKGSKKASVSIWRPHIEVNDAGERELCVVQTVTDQLFRDDVGNLVLDSQASLQLRLEDFGTEAFAVDFPGLTGDIQISAEQLFAFLERAEAKAKRVKNGEGLVRSVKPWVRKRRRDSTPPEQIASDREGRFAEQEQREAKKAMKDDVSYKASSSDADLE